MRGLNILILILLLLVCIFFFFGFIKFYFNIQNYKGFNNNINIEGYAVLTGGKGRIAKGIKSFRSNPNSYLLISGVDKKINIDEIIPEDFLENRKVFVDKKSETTLENAEQIINWSYKNKIKNISIITSDYHMPRSILILSKKGKGLNFYADPVTGSINFEKNIFSDISLLKFLLEEYFKYSLCLVL